MMDSSTTPLPPPRRGRTQPALRRGSGVVAPMVLVVLVASLLVGTATVAPRAAVAEEGVPTDSTWAPFVGEFRMWCTKSTGSGACASHHNGWAIDIDTPFNEPIFATGSGEVVQAYGGCDPVIGSCNSGAGNWVAIDHGDHWSRYIHLASFAPEIEVGAWIEAGELIGYAGASGTSNGGVHLHYDETLPQSLPVARVFFGPFLACHGDQAVQYPDVLGTTDWQQVPHGTYLRNDGYECLGGVTVTPPPPPPDIELAAPGGSIGLAIGNLDGGSAAALIVGIPGEDIGSKADAGLAIIAHSNGAGPGARVETAYQGKGMRGGAEPGDLVGAAIATGDYDCDGYDDLAIGAPGEDIGTVEDAGLVNVSYGGPTSGLNRSVTLYQNGIILPGLVEAGDLFGAALATGDFDNDGCDDLAIGVPGEDVGTTIDAGAAVVIHGSPAGFSSASFTAPTLYQGGPLAGVLEPGDLLGSALAAGDFNCDGFDDLAIGVPHEGVNAAQQAGAVSVSFSGPSGLGAGTTTIYQSFGLAGVLESGDRVGTALAAGDFNGDGCDDLAAGAADEDLSQVDAGAVSITFGSPSGFGVQAVYFQETGGLPGRAEAGDHVGSALVAVDLNCDGYDDLAIGAAGEGIGTKDDAGYVVVLRGTASGMNGTVGAYYQGSGVLDGANEVGDGVGTSLAAGDVDGDGCDDLAIGGPGEDIGSRVDSGVVWVVKGDAATPSLLGSFFQGKNLPGAAEAGDQAGGPSVTQLLGIAS